MKDFNLELTTPKGATIHLVWFKDDNPYTVYIKQDSIGKISLFQGTYLTRIRLYSRDMSLITRIDISINREAYDLHYYKLNKSFAEANRMIKCVIDAILSQYSDIIQISAILKDLYLNFNVSTFDEDGVQDDIDDRNIEYEISKVQDTKYI